jgi:hypothetical protein
MFVLKTGDHTLIYTHRCFQWPHNSRSVIAVFLSASIDIDGTPKNVVKPLST